MGYGSNPIPTATKAASSGGGVAVGGANGTWTTPSNAYSTTGDDVYATAAPGKNQTFNGDYGFAAFTTSDIPNGSLIDSVVVTVEWKMSAAVTGGTLGCFGRRNSDGFQYGPEVTKTTTTEAQSTVSLQGVTLTDLRTAGELLARVRCSKGNTTNAMTGSLDFCKVDVTYTAPPTTVVPVALTKLTGTGNSISGSVSATAGNALLGGLGAFTATGEGAITSLSRSTDSFTVDREGHTSAGANRSWFGLYSAPNVAGGAQTFSVTCTNGSGVTAYLLEASGLPTSSIQDGTPPVVANGNSGLPASNALTNATADAVYTAIFGSESGTNPSTVLHDTGWYDTYASSWTGEQNGASWPVGDFEFSVVASSASRTTTWTTTAAAWGAAIAVYKYQAAAAQDTPELYGRPMGLHGQAQQHQLLAQ